MPGANAGNPNTKIRPYQAGLHGKATVDWQAIMSELHAIRKELAELRRDKNSILLLGPEAVEEYLRILDRRERDGS